MSAVETLLVWEDLPTLRYHLRNNSTGGKSTHVTCLGAAQPANSDVCCALQRSVCCT